MTLKLMGLAFEVHETHKTELEKKYKHVYPNVLDIFHYAFSHAGILTGITFLPVPFSYLQIPNTEHLVYLSQFQRVCSMKSSSVEILPICHILYIQRPKVAFPFSFYSMNALLNDGKL